MNKTFFSILLAMLLISSMALAATIELPITGQTKCYDAEGAEINCAGTGQDGDKKAGVVWDAATRFTDNSNGTVTDNLTGLVWLENANCFGETTWNDALTSANSLASGACGLTDGSKAGDWRLPNRKELFSLVDYSQSGLALPVGHPFIDVNSNQWYWTSSTITNLANNVWLVTLSGFVGNYGYTDSNTYYVLTVRDGQ